MFFRHGFVFLLLLTTAGQGPSRLNGQIPKDALPKGFEFPGAAKQSGSLPARPAPNGFQSQDLGTGRLLTSPFRGNANSAKMVLRGYMQALSGYFDRMPSIVTAVVDARDQRVQALLNAQLQGVPVSGLLSVTLGNGSGGVSLLMDRPDRFANTVNAAQQGGNASGPPAASRYDNVAWSQVRAADGTSAVRVPQGWTARGQNGTFDIQGPQGESVVLGVSLQYIDPSAGFQHQSVAPYTDPTRALVLTYGRQGYPLQVIESQQTQSVSGNGPAFYVLAKVQIRGQPYYAWGLTSSSPTSNSTWIHYFSLVSAPQSIFAREFQTMRKIWGSWSISQELVNQRMQAALQAMRETNAIISQTQQEQSDGRARLNHAWGVAFQGGTYIHNTQTNGLVLARQNGVNDLVDQLNRQEGARVWRELPSAEYPTR
ncbi:MAG: hypothetical protein ABI823_19130 [Bryobacteraceae bacterium]